MSRKGAVNRIRVRPKPKIEGMAPLPSHERLITAWNAAVEGALQDELLTDEEETALVAFQSAFGLTQTELDQSGAYMRLGKAAVLRDVMHGTIPEGLHLTGQMPFNFQKAESIIWCFNNVEYFETRTKTEYVGRSAGMSVRIARGIYYRTGAFHGQPIQTSQVLDVGTGPLAVTNKHLYFSGGNTSLRIPYSKIVSFQPFSDGIGIQRDAASAKPQIFRTHDGWFTYNLIINAARL